MFFHTPFRALESELCSIASLNMVFCWKITRGVNKVYYSMLVEIRSRRILRSDWLKGSLYIGVWTMQRSYIVKFRLILFYLGRYTIKQSLTKSLDHTRNVCFDVQGSWNSLFRSILLKRQNKYFLVWTSLSVKMFSC